MAGKPSAGQEAARRQWERAPEESKPSARELAARHGLSESTIHRAPWWKQRNNNNETKGE